MNTIYKIQEILHHFNEQGRISKQVDAYMTSRDFDDFQEDICRVSKYTLPSSSSWDKASNHEIVQYNFMGFVLTVHRSVYNHQFMVYEMGTDRDLYSRSIVVYDKGNQGKEIILL